MLTQIYEISTTSEADAISALGVDHVGVLVGNGAFPRERSAREAAAITAAIRGPSKPVGLFLSADFALIEHMAREVQPAGVDSKTRTDFGDTHTKDLIKVEAFNKAAKDFAPV